MANASQHQPQDPDEILERALVDHGDVDQGALARARRVCEETGERLDIVLTRLGLASEQAIAAALAGHLDIAKAEAADFPSDPILPDRLSAQFLRTARALPIAETGTALPVAG